MSRADRCIYIARLQNGIVKVGCTANPKSRKLQIGKSPLFGRSPVMDYWFSSHMEVDKALDLERCLIAFCKERSDPIKLSREYFLGVDFPDLLNFAQALEIPFVEKSHEQLMPDEPFLSAKALAEKMNFNPETIRRWTRDKKIPFLSVGSTKRYRLSQVLEALDKQKTTEEPSP